MDETWKKIFQFPRYSVSDHGRVRNDDTGRIMAMTVNNTGVVMVGLTADVRRQQKRGVALLVAKAFLEKPQHLHESFDTPINLDGDRFNNHVNNLMWRPRWFAVKYHQQFENNLRGFTIPVEEVSTGEKFTNSWEAALRYGLLDREIFMAAINNTVVWPTYQRFRAIEE